MIVLVVGCSLLYLVPVEIGQKYTDEDWRQRLMAFQEYLRDFVFYPPKSPPDKMGYLAQHRLLDQIPELLDDIIIPDYCVFGSEGGKFIEKIG